MCLIKQIPLATNYIDTRHYILNAIVTFSQTITDSSQYIFTLALILLYLYNWNVHRPTIKNSQTL